MTGEVPNTSHFHVLDATSSHTYLGLTDIENSCLEHIAELMWHNVKAIALRFIFRKPTKPLYLAMKGL